MRAARSPWVVAALCLAGAFAAIVGGAFGDSFARSTKPSSRAKPRPTTRAFAHLPGRLVWSADFEQSLLTGWDDIQAVSPEDPPYVVVDANRGICNGRRAFTGPERIRRVPDPVRQGGNAALVEVFDGDTPTCDTGNRSMLMRDGVLESEGNEDWYRWSLRFAPDFPTLRNTWQILVEWHPPGGNNQAPVKVDVYGRNLCVETVESNSRGVPRPGKTLWCTPLAIGQWHDFVAHIRWSTDRRVGFVEFWHRLAGSPAYELVVPRTPTRTLVYPTGSNYLLVGYYRGPDAGDPGGIFFDDFEETTLGISHS